MADQLPKTEDVPPDLKRAFRTALLQHLAKCGARTLKELEGDPPWTLGLPLDHAELIAALDLSRRRREIEPISETGWKIETGEWGLTDLGRTEARRLTSRVRSWVVRGSALTGVVALIGLGTTLGISPPLDFAWERWVTIAVAGLLVAEAAFLLLLYYRYGVSRSKIADKWIRYQCKRKHGYTFYTKRKQMFILAVVAVAVFVLLIFLPPCKVFHWIAIPVLIGIVAAQTKPLGLYRKARKEWASAEREERCDSGECDHA